VAAPPPFVPPDTVLSVFQRLCCCCRCQVGIIMGSDSDLPTMEAAEAILKEFGVPYELTIVSAHRWACKGSV
jgi:hypothetical protein